MHKNAHPPAGPRADCGFQHVPLARFGGPSGSKQMHVKPNKAPAQNILSPKIIAKHIPVAITADLRNGLALAGTGGFFANVMVAGNDFPGRFYLLKSCLGGFEVAGVIGAINAQIACDDGEITVPGPAHRA